MDVLKMVIENANEFYDNLQKDEYGRDRSWEHCYKCFYDARKTRKTNRIDYDYLSLQLAFYLASWGMYRGSSFLLNKDYKVHRQVVIEIMAEKYDCLLDLEYENLIKNYECLNTLYEYMGDYYDMVREKTNNKKTKSEVSSVLRTKILLGTLGCVPAYDDYFSKAIKKLKISSAQYGKKSLFELAKFYGKYSNQFESIRGKFIAYDLQYPQMKFLDMAFWQIGSKI